MIKNLHTTLFERGKIKIGSKGDLKKSKDGKEYSAPVKLDYFKITSLERGADRNFKLDQEAMRSLPAEPKMIPVEMLYDQIDLNFPTAYSVYQNALLYCKGDGETAVREGKSIACNPDTCKYAQSNQCKIGGILLCRLPQIKTLMGVYKFRTHGYNSVRNILASLQFVASLTGGIVAGLPFELRLTAKQTKFGTTYVADLAFPGDQGDLADAVAKEVTRRALLHYDIQRVETAAIQSGVTQDTDTAEDIAAEFFPETEKDEPRPTFSVDAVQAFREAVAAYEAATAQNLTAWADGIMRGVQTDKGGNRFALTNDADLQRVTTELHARLAAYRVQESETVPEPEQSEPAPAAINPDTPFA